MKTIIATAVFFLALGLTIKSVAADPEICTADKKENCVEAKASHANTKSANQTRHEVGNHKLEEHEEKLGKEMNSLFPPKQPNPAQRGVPEMVQLTSPKFLSKVAAGKVKLEWAPTEGASNYHVQVATDPNFKWLVANDQWVKTNSFDVSSLDAGKKYFWRVAAVKSGNDAMFTKSLFASSAFATQ